jgi:hypothetical protein
MTHRRIKAFTRTSRPSADLLVPVSLPHPRHTGLLGGMPHSRNMTAKRTRGSVTSCPDKCTTGPAAR